MKNFHSSGQLVQATAPSGGVSSGDGVLLTNLFGIAAADAVAGATFTLNTSGVYGLPKLSTDTIAFGQRVYWDATNKRVTETAAGNYAIGAAVQVAGNGAATVQVRLDGVSTLAEPT